MGCGRHSELCFFVSGVLLLLVSGALASPELTDELRLLQSLSNTPQLVLVTTWVPSLHLIEFVQWLAPCCVNEPEYYDDSSFICATENVHCLSQISGVTAVSRFPHEMKIDDQLREKESLAPDTLTSVRVHTVVQIGCLELVDEANCCKCQHGVQSKRRSHLLWCAEGEVARLASSHLVTHLSAEPPAPRVEFASKGANWIVESGGDSPAPYVPKPRYFSEISARRSRLTVSLADGLPQSSHQMFAGSNMSIIPLSTDHENWSLHGTLLAGVMTGAPPEGSILGPYVGIAAGSRIVVTETDAADLAYNGPWRVWQSAADAGSLVHVDPWGTLPAISTREPLWYTHAAFEVDEFFWRHRTVLNVRALGVPARLRGSVAFSEASSKNALVVGSTFTNSLDLLEQHGMFFPPVWEPQCQIYGICNASLSTAEFCAHFFDTPEELLPHDRWFCRLSSNITVLTSIAYSGSLDQLFSGLYLADGRVRPHLVLPGTAVVSAFPGSDSPLGVLSGASISAAIAGSMALRFAEYLQTNHSWQELVPVGHNTHGVPASLLRAMMLAGSRILKSDALSATSLTSLPENPGLSRTDVGYGRPQLDLMIAGQEEFSFLILANEQTSIGGFSMSNNPLQWCFQLNQIGGLVTVALTWPEPPSLVGRPARILNRLRLSVRETNTGATYVDTVQSANEQVLSFVPMSANLEISISFFQIVHNGSFSLAILSSPGTRLQGRICPVCIPGSKTTCSVPGGAGEATCNPQGFPGNCQVISCDTGYVPASSTASCHTLPSMFILTTVVSAAVCILISGAMALLILLAFGRSRSGASEMTRWNLLSLLRCWAPLLVVLVLLACLGSLMAAFSSFLTSSATDKAQDPSNLLSEYIPILIAVICTNCAQIVASTCTSFCQQIISAVGARNLRREAISRFTQQIAAVVVANSQQNTGDLLIPCSTVMSRPPQLTTSLMNSVSRLCIGFIILFALEWRISFAAVGCILILSCWTLISTRLSRLASKSYNENNVAFHALHVSITSLVEWMQASNISAASLQQHSVRNLAGWTSVSNASNLLSGQIIAGVIESTAIAVFCVALRSLQTGRLTFGLLMVFFQWMSQSISAFQGLIGVLNGWFGFRGESDRLLEHLSREQRTSGGIDLEFSASAELSARNISFHFPNSTNGFENVSLVVQPSKLSMLMGPSGVGKSSLLRVLVRVAEPTSGSVTLDGEDIRLLEEASLFSAITLIEQDVMLKRGTLEHNVCVGLSEEQMSEWILSISESIGASGWIASIPLGWQTPVTSGGSTLSGGQRKLIGILRAFARDTPIILADEVTSGLDPVRAGKVLATFLSQKRTVLMTTHQMELVSYAGAVFTLTKQGAELWSATEAKKGMTLGGARRQQ